MSNPAFVLAVCSASGHDFSKPLRGRIDLVEGLGVAGDAHCGARVQHRSRVAIDPTQPNLRQVHLIQAELFDELRILGFDVAPGDLGENVTTRGIDLLSLPVGALLRLGDEAVVEVTGLRNPCLQIDGLRRGLMKAVIGRDADGGIVRKAGVMGVVRHGGPVKPGDGIRIDLPAGAARRLEPV
jgi:hypothetical protein